MWYIIYIAPSLHPKNNDMVVVYDAFNVLYFDENLGICIHRAELPSHMASLARLCSVWAAGWAPCLDSLLAALPSPVRSLAGIPGQAELPTVLCIWAGLEAVLHGQAGVCRPGPLSGWERRLCSTIGRCRQPGSVLSRWEVL